MEDVVEVRGGKSRFFAHVVSGYGWWKWIWTKTLWHIVRNTPRVTGFVGSGTRRRRFLKRKWTRYHRVHTPRMSQPKVVYGAMSRLRIVRAFANFNGTVRNR